MGSSDDVQIGASEPVFPPVSGQRKVSKPSDSVLVTAEQEWAMWRGGVTEKIEQLLAMSEKQTEAIEGLGRSVTRDRHNLRQTMTDSVDLEERVTKIASSVSRLESKASFYIGGGAALLVIVNLAVAIWAVWAQFAVAGKP